MSQNKHIKKDDKVKKPRKSHSKKETQNSPDNLKMMKPSLSPKKKKLLINDHTMRPEMIVVREDVVCSSLSMISASAAYNKSDIAKTPIKENLSATQSYHEELPMHFSVNRDLEWSNSNYPKFMKTESKFTRNDNRMNISKTSFVMSHAQRKATFNNLKIDMEEFQKKRLSNNSNSKKL